MENKILRSVNGWEREEQNKVNSKKTGKLLGFIVILSVIIAIVFYYRSIHTARQYFNTGKKWETQGEFKKAITNYTTCIKNFPQDRYSIESLYRTAVILKTHLNDRVSAKQVYRELMQKYPHSNWSIRSREDIKECYNYFPLPLGGFWVEGDSESMGKNYRAEITCLGENIVSGQMMTGLDKKVYAGKKLVSTTREFLVHKDGYLVSIGSKNKKEYKLFPDDNIKVNVSWKSQTETGDSEFKVVSNSEIINTVAGKFVDCLKIRQETVDLPGTLRFDYYAPEVGHIVTTTATNRNPQEYRISELLDYKLETK